MKRTKKLVLDAQTIRTLTPARQLDSDELRRVNGGSFDICSNSKIPTQCTKTL